MLDKSEILLSEDFKDITKLFRILYTKNHCYTDTTGTPLENVWYPDHSNSVCWLNQEPCGYSMHWHPAIEIIMPIDNGYTVTMNDTRYELQEGDILIIPPGELHELAAPEHGLRMIYLFNYSVFSSLKGFSNLMTQLTVPILVNHQNSPNIYPSLFKLMWNILEEYVSDNPLWELSTYSLYLQFFLKLHTDQHDHPTQLPYQKISKQKEYIDLFNNVFEYIDKHYRDELTLEQVASSAGFSKYHFSRLFKLFTNTNFNDYVNRRRVRAAEQYLQNPEYSITDIALMSGFSSISTFNRVFKTVKNCTPSEFQLFCNADNESTYFIQQHKIV